MIEHRGRELGYVRPKDYWGRSLMPEAVRAASDWLFGAQGLDFLLAGHLEWNERSCRVVEGCGFEYLKTVPSETCCDTVEPTRMYILHPHGRISGDPVE